MKPIRNTSEIVVRSVVDGSTYTFRDDGYAAGDPSRPNQARANLQRALDKVDAFGDYIFYPIEKPKAWSIVDDKGRQTIFHPVRCDRKWDKKAEERLAKHREAAEERGEESRSVSRRKEIQREGEAKRAKKAAAADVEGRG